MVVCPNCRALNPDNFVFCGRCGKPLREEKEPEEQPEEIPSWLRELGEGLAAGPGPALRPGVDREPLPWQPEETSLSAGLPPWLEEEVGPVEEGPAEVLPAELPPWLEEEARPVEEAAVGLPPWLGEEVPAEEEPAEVPPWLEEEARPAKEAAAGLPPWLGEEGVAGLPEEAAPIAETIPVAEQAAPSIPVEPAGATEPWIEGLEAELPSWLRGEEAAVEVEEGFPPWPVAPAAVGQEEAPAALEGEAEASLLGAEPVQVAAAEERAVAETPVAFPEEEAPAEEAAEEILPLGLPSEGAPAEETAPPELEVERASWLPSLPAGEAKQVPEWARALQPQEGAQMAFLEGLDLPEWLRVEAEQREQAAAEPALSWLERLGEKEEVVEKPGVLERLPRPPLPPLSPARRRAADLFAALAAAPEPVPRPRATPAPSFFHRLLRWLGGRWPALFLLVALLVGWGMPPLRPEITQENWGTFDRIDRVLHDASGDKPPLVLVAFDWDVHRSGEMRPLATALVRHLLRPVDPQADPRRRPAVVAVSTTFQGGHLAQEVWESALAASGYEGIAYGSDFLNLSMRPGSDSALRLLASQPLTLTFPADHPYGLPADYYLLGKRLGSLSEVALLIVMAGEETRAVSWLEQVRSQYPDLPCVLVAPAELRPVLEPYLQARGIAPNGALWGVRAALEYEEWLGRLSGIVIHRDLPLEKRLNLLAVGQLSLVLLLVLGNLIPLAKDGEAVARG